VGAAKAPGSAGADPRLNSALKFTFYTNVSSLPVIRNEELILLKAEALWSTGDHDGATAELKPRAHQVRGLDPIATPASDDASSRRCCTSAATR